MPGLANLESRRLSPGRSLLRLLSVARPDWCALVKNNIAIILHSADDSTAASIRASGPDGFAINVTTQPYQPHQGSLNKIQHTMKARKKRIYKKQTYYMHRLPSVCIWMPLMSLRCWAVFWKWHTPPQYTAILPSSCILNSTEPSWLNRLLPTFSHSLLPRVLCVILNEGRGIKGVKGSLINLIAYMFSGPGAELCEEQKISLGGRNTASFIYCYIQAA